MIALVAAALLGNSAYAQESFGKCSVPTTSRMPPPGPVIVPSSDASHIARMESITTDPPTVRIQILKHDRRGRYNPTRTIVEGERPEFVLVSNAGRVASIGEFWAIDRVDNVRLYDLEGRLAFRIVGKDVFTTDQLRDSVIAYEKHPSCTPADPWICRSRSVSPRIDEDEQLVISDTLGGWVMIDMADGTITRLPDVDDCDMFDRAHTSSR